MSEPLYFLIIIIISSVLSALLFINANYDFVGNKDKPFLNLFIYTMFFLIIYLVLGGIIFMIPGN